MLKKSFICFVSILILLSSTIFCLAEEKDIPRAFRINQYEDSQIILVDELNDKPNYEII